MGAKIVESALIPAYEAHLLDPRQHDSAARETAAQASLPLADLVLLINPASPAIEAKRFIDMLNRQRIRYGTYPLQAANVCSPSVNGWIPLMVSVKAPEPNIVVLSARIMPIDEQLRLATPDSPVWAAIVRFRNEADPKREVGAMLGTRAQLTVSGDGFNPLHTDGIWMEERSQAVNFAVGDSHSLMLAARQADQVNIVEFVDGGLRSWNISASQQVQVRVRLIGGLSRTIVRDFDFTITTQPNFEFAQGR
jgi:hypothetical protein